MKNLILFSFLLCSLAAFSQTYYFEDAEIFNNNTDELISPVTAAVSCEYSEKEGGYVFAIIGFNEDDDSGYSLQFFFVIHSNENPDFYFSKGSTQGKNGIGLKDTYDITSYALTQDEPMYKNIYIATCYENGKPSSFYISQKQEAYDFDLIMNIPYTYENKKKIYELVELAKRKLGSN